MVNNYFTLYSCLTSYGLFCFSRLIVGLCVSLFEVLFCHELNFPRYCLTCCYHSTVDFVYNLALWLKLVSLDSSRKSMKGFRLRCKFFVGSVLSLSDYTRCWPHIVLRIVLSLTSRFYISLLF